MILGQIGKSGSGKSQSQYPIQCQTVRGHLHGGTGHACIDHFPQNAVQFQRFGGGTGGFPGNFPEKHAICTD